MSSSQFCEHCSIYPAWVYFHIAFMFFRIASNQYVMFYSTWNKTFPICLAAWKILVSCQYKNVLTFFFKIDLLFWSTCTYSCCLVLSFDTKSKGRLVEKVGQRAGSLPEWIKFFELSSINKCVMISLSWLQAGKEMPTGSALDGCWALPIYRICLKSFHDKFRWIVHFCCCPKQMSIFALPSSSLLFLCSSES